MIETRIGIVPVLLMGTILVTVFTVFIAMVVPFYRNAFSNEAARLSNSVRSVESAFSNVLSRSAISADLLSRNERLAQLMSSYLKGEVDADAISRHASVLQHTFDGELVEVISKDGIVVSSSIPGRAGAFVGDWHMYRGVGESYQPSSYTYLGDSLYAGSASSIIDGGKTLGTLVVGYEIDWWFLSSLARPIAAKIILSVEGRQGISTLRSRDGIMFFPDKSYENSHGSFEFDSQQFLSARFPVKISGGKSHGKVIGEVFIANPLSQFYITLSSMARSAAIWVLPVLLVGVLLSYVLAHLLLENATRMAAIGEKLAKTNENLESIVQERTQRIRDILDYVHFGFFLVGMDGKIQDGYTKSCEKLLERKDLVGTKLSAVVYPGSGDSALGFDFLFEQVFSDFLPQVVSLGQVPARFKVNNRDLSLEGSVINDVQGKVRSVLFSLADVTHLALAERLSRENGRLIRILGSRDSFVSFIKDTRTCLLDAYRASYQDDRKALLQDLHTIKGNAAMFGLDELACMVHELEERPEIRGTDLNCIEHELRKFLDESAHILNIRWDDLDSVVLSIPASILEKVEAANHASDIAELRLELAAVISESKKRRISEIVGPIAERTEQMAATLNKEVRVEVVGADMVVPHDHLKSVLKNLIHLLRNAVDHGIEFTHERGRKSKVAKIVVAFSEDDRSWRIEVADDGKGIDEKLIEKLAVERGLISTEQAQSMSASELQQLVFVSGFSTADRTSDISGRGRGTSATRDAVLGLGGEIVVKSSLGQGTSFYLTIPKPA